LHHCSISFKAKNSEQNQNQAAITTHLQDKITHKIALSLKDKSFLGEHILNLGAEIDQKKIQLIRLA